MGRVARRRVYVDQSLRVRTRRGRPHRRITATLVGSVDTLGSRTAILDGELVASPAGAVRARLIGAAASPTLKLLWPLPTQSGSKACAVRDRHNRRYKEDIKKGCEFS